MWQYRETLEVTTSIPPRTKREERRLLRKVKRQLRRIDRKRGKR